MTEYLFEVSVETENGDETRFVKVEAANISRARKKFRERMTTEGLAY